MAKAPGVIVSFTPEQLEIIADLAADVSKLTKRVEVLEKSEQMHDAGVPLSEYLKPE